MKFKYLDGVSVLHVEGLGRVALVDTRPVERKPNGLKTKAFYKSGIKILIMKVLQRATGAHRASCNNGRGKNEQTN